MINRLIGTWRNHPLPPRLRNACRCWLKHRPPWDLPASVKWLMYVGLLMYSRNLDSSDRIWEWGESYFGIPVPSLTASAVQEGFIAVCLLASLVFFIEPLLPACLRKQICAVRKIPAFTIVGGALSWAACTLGMLPIISATSDWWGGGLVFLWGLFLLLAMFVKWIIEVCKALCQAARGCRTATSR